MGRARMLRQLRLAEFALNLDQFFTSSLTHTHTSSSHFLKASDREERYLQYSKVPTMHFQPSLPRLPVPKLSDTGSRYLCALRPLVQDEQYQETERLVGEFVKEGGDGDGKGFWQPCFVHVLFPLTQNICNDLYVGIV